MSAAQITPLPADVDPSSTQPSTTAPPPPPPPQQQQPPPELIPITTNAMDQEDPPRQDGATDTGGPPSLSRADQMVIDDNVLTNALHPRSPPHAIFSRERNRTAPAADEDEDDFDGQAFFLREFREDTSSPPPEQIEEMNRQQLAGSRNFERSGLDDDHWTRLVETPIDDPAFSPKEHGKYTWHLDKFHGTKENPSKDRILRSPQFVVGEFKWSLKLFPHGCEGTDYVSVYLECKGPTDPAKDLESWDVAAQIGCIMFNPAEPRTHHFERASHHFEKGNPDWGWVRFYGPWRELHMRRFLEYRPMLQNDKLSFTAYVRVWHDPTKLLWSSNLKNGSWDSYKQTGFRGLTGDAVSQTAFTSAFSLLLHSAFFNNLVASVPVDDPVRRPEAKRRPMVLELKRLMSRWHKPHGSSRPDTLSPLQGVFSWYGYAFDNSADVVTIWGALSQILGQELSDWKNEAAEEQSLTSNMLLVRDQRPPAVTGVNVAGREDYKSVQEIFDNTEVLGESQVLFDPHGRLNVHERTPDVIAVELERSKFNCEKRKWTKLTHLIKLDPILRVGSKPYSLVGAVIHRGELGSGDFYSVIRPQASENWLKYRNGQASFLSKKNAIDIHQGKGENKIGQDSVAYVLLYAREDVPDLFPSREIFDGQHIAAKLHHAAPEFISSESIPVIIHDARNFVKHQGPGFVDPWNKDNPRITFNVRASTMLSDIQAELFHKYRDTIERKEQIRLWPIKTLHTAPRFTLELDYERYPDTRLSDFIFVNGGAHLWLEILPVEELELDEDSRTDPMAMSITSLQPAHAAPQDGTIEEHQDVVMGNSEDEDEPSESESDGEDGDGDDDEDDGDGGSSSSSRLAWGNFHSVYVLLKTFDPEQLKLECCGTYFVHSRTENALDFVRKTLKTPDTQRLKLYNEAELHVAGELPPYWDFNVTVPMTVILIASPELPDKIQEQRRQGGTLPINVVDWFRAQRRHHEAARKESHFIKHYFGGPYVQYCMKVPRENSVVVDSKGDAFVGELDLNWNKNGSGTMIYSNGDKYEGEWKDDLPDGQGKMTYKFSGDRYEGGWLKGRKHGEGITHHKQAADQLRQCNICYEEDINCAIYKCGHQVACVACSRELRDCPVCRRPVQDVLRLYPTF